MQAAQQWAGSQDHPPGALYVIATPIGNLADISLRALHVLSVCDAVAAEDTRVSAHLLRQFGLQPALLAVHQHNEAQAAEQVIARLQQGQRVAYISDAGTPAISDPGARLVHAVAAQGLRVMPLPGPSSVVTALSVAGDVHAQGFVFMGFLATKSVARRLELNAALGSLQAARSVVLFEAPHRIVELVQDLAALLPDLTVSLCRELSKQFETVVTMPSAQLPAWLQADANRQRGEFVIVLHALAPSQGQEPSIQDPAIADLLAALQAHMPTKAATTLMAQAGGWSRKALYELGLRLRQDQQAQAQAHASDDGSPPGALD